MKIPVSMIDWADFDKSIITALSKVNAICIISNEKVKYLYSTKEKIDAENLFANIFSYNNRVFFVPYRASCVLVMDVIREQFHEIDISELFNDKRERKVFFRNAFVYSNMLYMISAYTYEVFKLNMDTEELRIINIKDKEKNDPQRELFSCGNAIIDSCAYIPMLKRGSLLRIMLNSDEISFIDIPGSVFGVDAISAEGDNLLIVGKNKKNKEFINWNIKTNDLKRIELHMRNSKSKKEILHPPVYLKNKLYLFFYTDNKSYVIDLNNNEYRLFEEFNDSIHKVDESYGVFKIKQNENIITFQTKSAYKWGCYDLESGKVEWKESGFLEDGKYDLEVEKSLLKNDMESKGILYENADNYGLEALLGIVRDGNSI